MDYKYNAFISYRHEKEDEKVAEHLHDALERYHIPKSAREKADFEGSFQIFRDKFDLPVTDSLNDTIGNAIKESEYLIVICSPHTRDSIWVDKEIELFLKTHSRKNIFTVLVSGEPKEVIPETLLYEEVSEETEEGEIVTIRRPLEPLSCDYRSGIKKARKTELPRLAAGLLGCTYEDLIRRQQQYRFRLFAGLGTAALLAVLTLAGYMYWSAKSIRDNYEKALYNQSEYLAQESIRVKDEDQELAIQLALEALPSEDNDRPCNPHAQYALANAVDAYRAPNPNQYEPVRSFKVENRKIESIAGNDKGTMVAEITDFGEIYVWDVESGRIIMQKSLKKKNEFYSYNSCYFYKDTLWVYSGNLQAYNISTGELIFDRTLFAEEYDNPEAFFQGHSFYYVNIFDDADNYEVHCQDMANYPYKDTLLCKISKESFAGYAISQVSISEDGRYVCFLTNKSSDKKKGGHYTEYGQILICDNKNHSHKVMNFDEEISSICFGKKDQIVVSLRSLKSDYDSKLEMPAFYDAAENYYSIRLQSYEAGSGDLVWESKPMDTFGISSSVKYHKLRFAGEKKYTDCYIQGSGDSIVFYDVKNGSCINKIRIDGYFNRFINDIPIRSDSLYCLEKYGGIYCIVPSKEEGSHYYHYYRLDNSWSDIIANSFENGIIFTRNNDTIKTWRNDSGDEGILVSGSSRKNDYHASYYSVGSYLATVAYDSDDHLKYYIDFYDVHKRQHMQTVELSLEDNSLCELKYIGSSEKNDYILVGDNQELLFFIVNVRSGDFQRIELKESVEDYLDEGCSLENTESCLKNGKLILYSSIVDKASNYQIVEVQYNVDNGETNYNSLLKLDSNQNEFIWEVDEEGSMAYCFLGDGRELLLDLADKKKYQVRKKERNDNFYNSSDTIHAFWDNETKKAVLYEGDSIIVVDTSDGRILYEEENDGVSRIGLHGDDLYYLENEGIFKQINYMNKETVGSVSIDQYDDMESFVSDDWRGTFIYKSDSILLFLLESYAIELNTNDLQIKNTIHNLASYNPAEDCWCIECTDYDDFIHSKDGNYKKYLSVYPRYSLDDLIKKGKELTRGRELDRTTKLRYGIE